MSWIGDFQGTARQLANTYKDLSDGVSVRGGWDGLLRTADTVTETDVVGLFAGLPSRVGSRAGDLFRQQRESADRRRVLDHALADASGTLIESLKEAQDALDRVRNQTNKSDTALAQANITAIATQAELMAALAQLQAYRSAREAGASYERELARRQELERWTAVLAPVRAGLPAGPERDCRPAGHRRTRSPVHHPSPLPVALRAREQPMPQLTPVTIPPGEQWDAKPFFDQVLAELIQNGAAPMQTAGLAIWTGMATVMIVWTGLKTAFSGDYDLWEIVKLVIGLGIPRTMLAFYDTPLPGTSMSFPMLITEQGTWATNVFIGDAWKDAADTLTGAYNHVFHPAHRFDPQLRLHRCLHQGDFLSRRFLDGKRLFMALMLILLLLMFCLLMAQVIWAQFALAVAILIGPILIPWMVFPPMSFLFWGWFRTMLTYTFYGVIAGAVFNIFMNVGLAFLDRLITVTLSFEDLFGVFSWYIILWPLIISGILASLKVGELAQLLVSGAGSAGAGLGTRVRQVAMAAKSGGASLAAGR